MMAEQKQDMMRVLITAPDRRVLETVLRDHPVDTGCTGGVSSDGAGVRIEALVPADAVEALPREKVEVEVLGNASAAARSGRTKSAAATARRANPDSPRPRPQGQEDAMSYLNVDEVATTRPRICPPTTPLCTLITLPHPTFEGRTCRRSVLGGGAPALATA